MKTVFRDGPATVTVSGNLEAMARRLLENARQGAGGVLLQVAEEVESDANVRWYQQVKRRTGKSGKIVSTLEIREDSVVVKVGSTDDRTGKGGKPSVVFVRRPGALSIIERPATDDEYHARRSAGMKPGAAYWIKDKPNPLAADGGWLLLELVRKPFRAAVKRNMRQLTKKITNGK